MEKKTKEQQQAELLYLHTEFDQQQIADFLHVDRKTLFRWIKENGWKRAKYAAKHAPAILTEQLYGQLGELNNFIAARTERPFPTKEEADIQRKLSLSITTVKGNGRSLGDYIEMMYYVTSDLKIKDKAKAENAVMAFDHYIKGVMRDRDALDAPFRSYLKGMRSDKEMEEWAAATRPVTPPPSKISITDDEGNTFSADPEPEQVLSTDDILREAILKVNSLPIPDDAPVYPEEVDTDLTSSDDRVEANDACPDSYPRGNEQGNDGAIISSSENENSLTTNTLEDSATAPLPHPEKENTMGHGDSDSHRDEPGESIKCHGGLESRAAYYATLPPEQRPSPFRDGDILWVNNIDDVDNYRDSFGDEWGERKIGDTIRYYPGMEPWERKNRAA